MAIYRAGKPRWRVAAAGVLAGLVVGGALGSLIARRGEGDPLESLRKVRSSLVGAAGVLDVVEIEYREASQGGSRQEQSGATGALARSRARYREVRPSLEVIDPEAVRNADEAYEELGRMLDRHAPADEVTAAADALRELLESAIGG